jgi:predicted Zn-dependent protease
MAIILSKCQRLNRALAHVFKGLIATLLVALGAASLPARAQLPTLGDGSEISTSDERRLGDRIVRELYRDPDYLDDAVLADYVQTIWQPLLAAARLRGDLTPELDERFAWDILLARARSVNAFALPGGYLGVHLGLIGAVGSRDELAAVLGHELSHVTQRHISRLISKQGQQTPWMIGAMILGVLAASKSPDAASALIVGGQAVAVQNQLNFSRDMEREADRVGFGVMTQAGFEPQGAVAMFDKLQQASRLNDNGAYPYLRSHPLTTERIADMRSRQPLDINTTLPLQADHAMIAARARVLSNPGVDGLRALLAEAQTDNLATASVPRQAGALYGAALVASQSRDFAAARQHLRRLDSLALTDARAIRLRRLLVAEIALAADDLALASASLAARPNEPVSAVAAKPLRPELLLGAMTAVRAGQPEALRRVAQSLQAWVAEHPRDAQAWQVLSNAYTALGQTGRAVRATAETQVAQLDYGAALDRFRAAQDLARQGRAGGTGDAAADHIDASIIDTRKREMERLVREQALER